MFINSPFFISASIHFVFIGFVVFNNYNPKIEREDKLSHVKVSTISVSKLDALSSKKPKININKQANLPNEKLIDKKDFSSYDEKSQNISNKFDNKNRLKLLNNKMEELPRKNHSNKIPNNQMKLSKNDNINKKFSAKEIKGNEKNSIKIEKKFKAKPRAVDRIDDMASIKTINQVISAEKNILNRDLNEKTTLKKIPKKTQSIESTTKINPEGKKEAKIIVSSGAIQSSIMPLSRPKFDKENIKKPKARPSVALLKKSSQSNYDDLIENYLQEDKSTEVFEISMLEQQLIKNAVKKAVETHWEVGILVGMSNYEKYVVKVQFMLDKRGNIYGDIKPMAPKKLGGKYVVAFRLASNALLNAQPIILPVDIENRINITMNFDPLVGLGF